MGLLASCTSETKENPDSGLTDARLTDTGGTDSGLTPAAGGGFCCPIETPTCNCFRNGGWVASDNPAQCPGICDLAPPAEVVIDEHGCKKLWGQHSCLVRPRDAGLPLDAASDGRLAQGAMP
ncbi:MAG: hypothetical protein HY698_05475 [Deltaproteobacteria bacterium]|nr:hypothetical protein [Deltaproteobacteria bacterium]